MKEKRDEGARTAPVTRSIDRPATRRPRASSVEGEGAWGVKDTKPTKLDDEISIVPREQRQTDEMVMLLMPRKLYDEFAVVGKKLGCRGPVEAMNLAMERLRRVVEASEEKNDGGSSKQSG